VERQRGPFALWEREAFQDGVVEAKLVLDRASEFGSLLLRSNTEGDEQRGYEVVLDPRQQQIMLLRHAKELVTLARSESAIPTVKPITLRIELAGPRIRVWTDGATQSLIDVVDSNPMNAKGSIGVRAWGAPLSVDKLSIFSEGKKIDVIAAAPVNRASAGPGKKNVADRRALESFCLMLLNLNEMIYVD